MTSVIFFDGLHHRLKEKGKVLLPSMIHPRPIQHPIDDLAAIAEELEKHYYMDVKFICSNALIYIAQVMEMDVHGAMALNIVLCEQIIGEVMDLIEYKRKNLISYLLQLAEKQEGGHNCNSCSGKCHMEHGLQLMTLKESNKKLESILYHLQTEGTPLHDIDYPQLYGALRNQMTNLENKLRELFFYEETHVMPGIMNAQKRINVFL